MNRVSSFVAAHPITSLVLFMFAVFALGTIGVEIVRINIRFALMTSEMAHRPLGLFPTLNGEPYADYPSIYNFLSYLASGGGRMVNSFTLALPTILLSGYVVAMTAKTSELIKPGSGLCAALFSLLSYEYLNIFTSFSIDLAVSAAALTIVWSLLKFDFGAKALPLYALMLFFAFAVRGPLGIILGGAVTASVILGARRWKALIPYGVTGAAVAAVCLGAAYWAIHRQGGGELWRIVVQWQVGSRIGGKKYFYYFTNAIASFMPVTGFMAATLVMKRKEILKPEMAILLLWAVIPMILLSIPGGKHLRYMTPLLPAFAIAAAIGYLDADRSYAGRIIDFAVKVVDKLILPIGVGLTAVTAAMSRFLPADNVSLFVHLALALALLLTMYFSLRRFSGKPWPLVRAALAATILMGIVMTSADAMWENSSRFVEKAERLLDERHGRLYLYELSPDHDALKVVHHLSPEARRNAVTIYRFAPVDSEHIRRMFPTVSAEEALAAIRPEDVVILHRKTLEKLTRKAEKAGFTVDIVEGNGRLGHKKAVAVRVLRSSAKK